MNVLFQLAFPFYIRNNPTHISAMQRTIQPINKLKTYENRAPQTGDLKYGWISLCKITSLLVSYGASLQSVIQPSWKLICEKLSEV